MSVGLDRRMVVHREKPNGLSLVVTGTIEETHRVAITACAVSQEAQLIATAAGGEIRLWNKQVRVSLDAPQSSERNSFSSLERLPALDDTNERLYM